MICTCDARKTAEVDSGVASAGVAARVVAETANAKSWGFLGLFDSGASVRTRKVYRGPGSRRFRGPCRSG